MSHPPLEKGLSPATDYWAEAWFVLAAVAGIIHLNIGYVFQFLEELDLHGLTEALTESGSWLFALNGVWLYIFSNHGREAKPEFIFTVLDGHHGGHAAFELGFNGFPVWAGFLGVAMIAIGFVLLALGEPMELIEFHTVFVHVLSYLRIPAVLLAKAGMAFAVNLLFFGAYSESTKDGVEYHFMLSHGPEYVLEHSPEATIMFEGLMHGSVVTLLVGILVLVVGHLIVLALGVTSSGIQAARLEYFEFFAKFYDGNGRSYRPFGYERRHSTEQ
jgi:V/A-type H+-transporting ATPase subunit I